MNPPFLNQKYGADELIILGSGGARHIATNQLRSCGGFILRANQGKIQCHIDPGPSAIRDLRDWKINPKLTNYVLVTHFHIDHISDLPLIVEALQTDKHYKQKKGTLVLPKEQLDAREFDRYFLKFLDRVIGLEENQWVELESEFRLKGTHTVHDTVPNLGYILEIGSVAHSGYHYKIAFTSDTAFYDGYVDNYQGVDILVANILRPDRVLCRGHLTTDEFIPLLKAISPQLCILVHLGGQMHEQLTDQIQKIQHAVGDKIIVIGGEDGLHIPFSEIITKGVHK